jgi:hypothetical protein
MESISGPGKEDAMTDHRTGTRDEWLAARLELVWFAATPGGDRHRHTAQDSVYDRPVRSRPICANVRNSIARMADIDIERRLREAGSEFIEAHWKAEVAIREAATATAVRSIESRRRRGLTWVAG